MSVVFFMIYFVFLSTVNTLFVFDYFFFIFFSIIHKIFIIFYSLPQQINPIHFQQKEEAKMMKVKNFFARLTTQEFNEK